MNVSEDYSQSISKALEMKQNERIRIAISHDFHRNVGSEGKA